MTAQAEHDFDVVVLGGGSAGEVVAKQLAEAGRSVAMVEEARVGGTCPYVSCMPSKTMLRSADLRHDVTRAVELGARAVPVADDDPAAAFRVAAARRDVVTHDRSDASTAQAVTESGVELIRGRGFLRTDRTLVVDDTVVGYVDLVVSTGSQPSQPDVDGLAELPTWSSDDALSSSERPASLVILGGGPVGCELAQLYARFGTDVTLIEAAGHLLGPEEPEVAALLADRLRNDGVTVVTDATVERAEPTDAGARVLLGDGSSHAAERIVVATGRAPSTACVRDAGLPLGERGELLTDPTCRVEGEQHVWAAGDVTGIAPFTHTANYQARIVVANVLRSSGAAAGSDDRVASYDAIPRTVYTDPPVASVGLSSAKAREAGLDVLVESQDVRSTARNSTEGSDGGLLVLTMDRAAGVLVGASAIGPRADEWLAEATLAIRARIPVAVLADVVHPFPTFSEAYEPPVRRLFERAAAAPHS